MAIRTAAQIRRDMKAWLEARIRIVDTGSPTVLYALVLQAYAEALGTAHEDLSGVQVGQGISDPAAVADSDFDEIAYNFSITRKAASQATGFITCRRASIPTATIRVGSEDGTGGVIVGTGRDADGSFVQFETTESVFFTTSTTKDPVTNLYEVSAPLRALSSGISGNKSAGDITVLLNGAKGTDSVLNKTATTGGKNSETNAEMALRLISRILGLQPGIEQGLRSEALGVSGVQDASVVGPDDSEFQRPLIGAVDLVVKGSASATAIDQFTYSGPTAQVLENLPTSDILSNVSTIGLTQVSLTENSQWAFSQDQVGENRYSNQANDHLSWLGSDLPEVGASVIVTYTYDTIIQTIQDVVDARDKHYPAARIQVKKAQPITIDITFSTTRLTTVGSTQLKNDISTAITNYLAGLAIGTTIKQSALVSLIKDVTGVDTLSLPFSKQARRGSSGTADIALTKYEYPIVDEQSINITVTN